jgi:FMN reductase
MIEAVAAPIRILALGGTTRPGSTSERALRISGAAAENAGAEVEYLLGESLVLPIYDPSVPERSPEAAALVAAVKRADGLILASPGYHGGMSGMIKNAIDYIEDLREHDRAYLDGLPVGLIAVAAGWQAAVTTLENMRTVVHALRGWPTPFGAAVNISGEIFVDGADDATARGHVELVADQVVDFARAKRLAQKTD